MGEAGLLHAMHFGGQGEFHAEKERSRDAK